MDSYLTQMVQLRKSINESPPEGFHYWCGEDYVLTNGQRYKSGELTEAEHEAVMEALANWGRTPIPRHCFHNAQMLTMNDHSGLLTYVEGYANGLAPIPLHHGWLAVGGKVVDLTWRTEDGHHIQGYIPKGWCYYGAEFSREVIVERALKREATHSLLDDWEEGFPLYKEARPGEEA